MYCVKKSPFYRTERRSRSTLTAPTLESVGFEELPLLGVSSMRARSVFIISSSISSEDGSHSPTHRRTPRSSAPHLR